MTAVAASVAVTLAFCLTLLPWLKKSMPWGSALANSVVFGTVGGAVFASGWSVAGWLNGFTVIFSLVMLGGAGWALRLAAPLEISPRTPRRENLTSRAIGSVLFSALAVLGLVYLWANAVHPPILAEALFEYSAPARGLGSTNGLAVRFSTLFYALDPSDLGWKFVWSVLNLLPLLAVYGSMRIRGRGRLPEAGALLVLSLAFSYLFWASSGHPAMFAAGVLIVAWTWALSPGGSHLTLLLAAGAAAAWLGPYWCAQTAIAFAAGAVLSENKYSRGLLLVGAAGLLTMWLWRLEPNWGRLDDLGLHFGRDAWNLARYGALSYLTMPLLLRWGGVGAVGRIVPPALVVSLGVFFLEMASRPADQLSVLVHVDGNRLFTAFLIVAFYLSLRMTPENQSTVADLRQAS